MDRSISPSKNFFGHEKVKFTQSSLERAKRRTKSRKCVNVSSKLKKPPPPKPMTRQPFHSGLKFRVDNKSTTRTFEATLTHSEPEQVNHRVRDLYKEQIPVLEKNFSIVKMVDKCELPVTSSRKNSISELEIKDIEPIEHPNDPEIQVKEQLEVQEPESSPKMRLLKEIEAMEKMSLDLEISKEKGAKKAEPFKHSPDWVTLKQGHKQKEKKLKKLKKYEGSILVRNRRQSLTSSDEELEGKDFNKNVLPRSKYFFREIILSSFHFTNFFFRFSGCSFAQEVGRKLRRDY